MDSFSGAAFVELEEESVYAGRLIAGPGNYQPEPVFVGKHLEQRSERCVEWYCFRQKEALGSLRLFNLLNRATPRRPWLQRAIASSLILLPRDQARCAQFRSDPDATNQKAERRVAALCDSTLRAQNYRQKANNGHSANAEFLRPRERRSRRAVFQCPGVRSNENCAGRSAL